MYLKITPHPYIYALISNPHKTYWITNKKKPGWHESEKGTNWEYKKGRSESGKRIIGEYTYMKGA